jgi:hypothetical protein
VVSAIAAESPSLVVVLGDLVTAGASCRDWRAFDRLAAPLIALGVPVAPTIGNHDYAGPDLLALRNLGARFPGAVEHRWREERHGRLALVWLDSNRDDLGPDAWAGERTWFASTLAALDADPQVSGVLVFLHHPPFTNSTVTTDDAGAREAFVEPFLRARRTLAMFSGHAHAYEHFVERGKDFIVSGGGGGPRVRLLEGAARRHPDLFAGPSPRPFHYVLATETGAGVSLRVRAVDVDGGARDLDRIELPFR